MLTNASIQRNLDFLDKDESNTLGLTIGNQSITKAQYIPRADAQSAPEVSFAVPSQTATYMVVCLDLDAPFPSFGILSPILHWMQPGLKASGSKGTLTSSEPFIADYMGPAPPPISSPHRYVFFLYEQPATFDAKEHAPPNGQPMAVTSRMRFDLDGFERTAKLGEPVAVNYFMSN